MKHLMIDIETLGTSDCSHILSIGAVVFDAHNIFERFYECLAVGDQKRDISIETVYWWMRRCEAFPHPREGVGSCYLTVALSRLRDFITRSKPEYIWSKHYFDVAVLTNAFRQVFNCLPPWTYRQVQDYSSVVNFMAQATHTDRNADPTNESNTHNALEDAENQARNLMALMRREMRF